MRRRLLLLSTPLALVFALAIGIAAAHADNAIRHQTTGSASSPGEVPACGGPPCGAGIRVLKDGTGSGTVTSVPAGIDCGSTCAFRYAWHTSVTLTATPAVGSTFSGWSGACTGTGTCKMTASASPGGTFPTVTATFTLISDLPNTLGVSRDGTGWGTVSSVPAGIDCGASCVSEYPAGTSVTLSATPDDGSTFTGWSGACGGTGKCEVTIGAQTGVAVTATFALIPQSCVVPNVKHKTLAAAELSIEARGCSVGRITHHASRRIKRGHVISQSPKPGAQLTGGAKVNLVVSKGRR